MHFTKMHGLGNDYIYVYSEVPDNIEKLSQELSKEHFGIGSDGMIYISKSDIADFKMRIFNSDGSEAKMCGNGIRCVGKYVYDKAYTDKTDISIETLSGIKNLKLHIENNNVKSVTVDMGKAYTQSEKHIRIENFNIIYMSVSIGNSHAVIFTDDVNTAPIEKIGYAMNHSELFPDGINVEFVQEISENNLRMRVWERGSQITYACGTGACASAAAAIAKGICSFNTPINVILDGGELTITVSDNYEVSMTGSAETVFEGEISI